MNLKQLDKFHQTRTGYAVFGLVELGLVYLFGSLAENSGSLWQWVLTALFVLGFVQNLARFLGTYLHGKN